MREDGQHTGSVAARVRAAWVAVLRESRRVGGSVDPEQGFLAAGGHSLAAARLIARLSGDLAVELPMSAIMRDDPSLTQLVEVVAEQVRARPGEAVTPQPTGAAASGPTPDRAAGPGAPAPSSPASSSLAPTMRRIWIWHRLHPDSPAYNVVRVLSVAGRMQPTALRAGLADLSARHEALRCAVVEPRLGQPEVLVGDPVAVPLSVEVVRHTDRDPMTAVDEALYRIANRPFPMATPPLWRVGIVYVPTLGRTWLILVMHHLISDLRASDVVLADLAVAYRARAEGVAPSFAAPAPSLLAHLAHEGRLVGTSRWEEHLAWWSRRLSGASGAVSLPLSAAERDEQVYAGSTHSIDLPADESDAMDRTLQSQSLTPAIFFLTAASPVLAAWSGQDRAEVLGLPSVRISRPEDERLVGFLLDTLLLPVSVDRDQSFLRAYDTVRDAFVDAADHALPAFDDIVDRLRLPRTGGARSPLIRLWFNDLTQAATPPSFGNLPAVEYDLPPAWALFDLGLYLRRSSAGYRLHLVTPRGLCQPADMAALLRQIARTAARAAADPARPLGELLESPAGTGRPARPADIGSRTSRVESTVDLVRRHGRQRPTAVAVADQHGALDYRSLHAQVDELAAVLRAAAELGAVVALPARRDRRFVLRLLACWRAGATAVLVDAEWPQWRRRRALEIAAVTHVFPWSGDGPPAAVADVGRVATPSRHSAGPAHVLYTSGTTGDPRAVRVSTPLAESALADLADRLGMSADDRVSMLSGPAHDPVLRDLGLALRAGATVCVPPPEVVGNPGRLGSWLRQERVSVVNATPTMLALVLGADRQPLPDLRAVVCGGSPLSAATAALIRSRAANAVVVNGYGCTETPQLVVAHEIAPGQPLPPTAQVPIGEPLPGRRIEVRAADGRRCAVGQLGELWVAGPHIAEGYLGTGDTHRFATDDDGLRWLRTGDLVRRDAAGRLHLAGRTDRQVLVNGYRVTLEEIESVAHGCAGVTDSVAQVIGDDGRQAVRVWVQRSADASVTEDAVRAHLATALPASAMPARVLMVDRLEVSENLKPMVPEQEPAAADRQAAGSLPDSRLRELAESMLGRPLDPTTNFFDAGFTSISLLQLSAELTDMLGRPVEALSMFEHPNLRALSVFLFGPPAPQAPPPEHPVPAVDRSDRLARMRSTRQQVRTWIQDSATSPGAAPQPGAASRPAPTPSSPVTRGPHT
jgi:amino acid adenylation domain-containing protein